MRPRSDYESNQYLQPGIKPIAYYVRVITQLGRAIELSNLDGRDWVKDMTISESVDSPSMECVITLQSRWSNMNLSNLAGSPINFSGGTRDAVTAHDNRLEVYTRPTAEAGIPEICIFKGRIISSDAGGKNVKIVARDCVHDLTQVWIAPGDPAEAEPVHEPAAPPAAVGYLQ